jgi:hypothetical protein
LLYQLDNCRDFSQRHANQSFGWIDWGKSAAHEGSTFANQLTATGYPFIKDYYRQNYRVKPSFLDFGMYANHGLDRSACIWEPLRVKLRTSSL